MTAMTEEQQSDLWRLRTRWVGIYNLVFADDQWRARRYATSAAWITAGTAEELGEKIKADYARQP
jgi:hypothetical protein